MRKLIAKFEVRLPNRFLVNRSENDALCYQAQIEDFDISISLIPEKGWQAKFANEKHYSFGISKALVSVGHDEPVKPPPVRTTEKGGKDYTVQEKYFSERLPKYRKIAATGLNRVIRFFKYRLRNPLLQELSPHNQDYQNPEWTDENGQVVGKGIVIFVSQRIPGLLPCSFGSQRLTAQEDSDLKSALESEIVPELYEELLSDAQTAFFQNNLRRAILEMAIACEVIIKQSFFRKSTAAAAAFEYLEDKRRVSVSPTELIDGVAKQAFGKSFKDVSAADFKNIDFLFRCRNKIAHRGDVNYRDDAGVLHTVKSHQLEEWEKSVEKLIAWLHTYR